MVELKLAVWLWDVLTDQEMTIFHAVATVDAQMAVTSPAFQRFRDKAIDDETTRLYCEYRKKYLANSRDTEYDKISAWISKSESVAWVHGGAGMGKSTFAHHLVVKLGESKQLATFGFFRRDPSPTVNLNNVIDHMAYELGCRHQDIIPYLAAVNPPSDDLSVRLSTLIVTPLRMLPGNEPKVIILDALDECSRPQDLLGAICEILHGIPSNVKFLVTSRSGGEIESLIKQMQYSTYDLNMSLAESSTMETFFNHRLKDVRDLQKYMGNLINRADGLFIWADTVCTFITSSNSHDPSELLKIVLSPSNSLYLAEKPLDDLYSAVLSHLFPPTNQLARNNFKVIFTAIYVAFDPLNEQALEELVGEAPRGIISSLRSLQIRPSNDGRVAPAADLFHASFLDFIISRNRCVDADFRIEPVEAHKNVTTLCIKLLSKKFKDNGPMPYTELSAAVHYAIGNWASHAAQSISKLDSRDVPSEWKTFLRTHGNYWGELVLSIIAEENVPASINAPGQRDDLLSWLNGEFIKLYRKKPLGGHLRRILYINRTIEQLSRTRKAGIRRQFALLWDNLFRCIDIPAKWIRIVSLWPRENAGLAVPLTSLASSFYFQFLSKGFINDLDEAISLSQAARSLQPAGHITLNNLAIYLLSKFHQTGNERDLTDAVDLHQFVVNISPPRCDRAWSFNNLASSLQSRFEQTGSKEDLEKAIELHEHALRLLSSDPDRPISLGNLALCFEASFKNDGSVETLEEAISLHKQALNQRDNRHPEYPGCLIALAHSLRLRGKHIGSQEDLDKAIFLGQEALGLCLTFPLEASPKPQLGHSGIQNQCEAVALTETPPRSMQLQKKAQDITLLPPAMFIRWSLHHTNRCTCLISLASSLETRFEQNRSLKDLDKAISLRRDALELRSAHADRALFMSDLGFSLLSRFAQTGSCKDIDEAISLLREALELHPASHKDLTSSLSNLASSLSSRFEQSGSSKDVDEAISLSQQALELRSVPHPGHRISLDTLAFYIKYLSEQIGSQDASLVQRIFEIAACPIFSPSGISQEALGNPSMPL